jgi:hypothetical protein
MGWLESIFGIKPSESQIMAETMKRNKERMAVIEAKKEEEIKAEEGLKYVINNAKLECKLCTNPEGKLIVNLDTPSIQDKRTATVAEKDMKSLVFMGNCKKSPNSSSPCAAVMQLGKWEKTGTGQVQDKIPLLLKSTIKCNYGGVDIKITDCGQREEVEEVDKSMMPAEDNIEDCKIKVESSYFYDHLQKIAQDTVPKFNTDDKGFVHLFYKDFIDGKIINPKINVKKSLTTKKSYYDKETEKIVIWEKDLFQIENDDDKKENLLKSLATGFGAYIDNYINENIKLENGINTIEYDLIQFDAFKDESVKIATIESKDFQGEINMNFEQKQKITYKSNPNQKGGPSPVDYEMEFSSFQDGDPTNPNPPFNIGLKFAFSLGGGFTISAYAGISKQINVGEWGAMGSLNAAITYYGYGTPGTSPTSRSLLNATLTPAATVGYGTGTPMNMNMFNSFTGSGVNVPFEYAFSLGNTFVLSSGRTSANFDRLGNKLPDEYNTHDTGNRHQRLGGTSIKIGNFMVSSFNDVNRLPLFFGMNSDQYWSAGVNMQAKITDNINMAYAFDLYYGKSNNKNPYNKDKIINGQNYDYQGLFDVLLNRGQETFSFTDAMGNLNKTTKFGYGTFWPSNLMHDNIPFPDKPIEPIAPVRRDYKDELKFKAAEVEYEKTLAKFERDKMDYKISMQIKPNATFHHLFLVYNDYNKIDFNRFKIYFDSGIHQKSILYQDLYKLEDNNKSGTKK